MWFYINHRIKIACILQAIFLYFHLQPYMVWIGCLSITDKEIDILENFQVY
jgi:hypothetical protein